MLRPVFVLAFLIVLVVPLAACGVSGAHLALLDAGTSDAVQTDARMDPGDSHACEPGCGSALPCDGGTSQGDGACSASGLADSSASPGDATGTSADSVAVPVLPDSAVGDSEETDSALDDTSVADTSVVDSYVMDSNQGDSSTPDSSTPVSDASTPPPDVASIADSAPVDAQSLEATVMSNDGGVADPTQTGPYTYAEMDGAFTSTVDGSSVAVHVAYPTAGPTVGPYPVVLFAHGFLVDQSEYYGYIQRAASFGYVGITVNYVVSLTSSNFVNNATDMLGGLDWLQAQSQGSAPPLAGLANTNLVGASGHSFGGQLSIVEAANDARIKAVIAFDPVEGAAQACSSAGDCPLASTLLPLPIPTGFVGETLDSVPTSSASQACAPPADNYMAFYMPASSPSYEVTVIGAGTASFVDSVSSCGLWCSLCAIPTAPQAQVLNVAYAYLVSFYERYLRNNMGYQSFLNGTAADQLFVNPGAVTLASK